MTGIEQGLVLAVALVLLWAWARSVRRRRRAPQAAPPPPAPKRSALRLRTLIWLCILGLVAWAVLRFVFTGQP